MSASAITMMIIGVLIIWGGFGASVALAISKAKEAKRNR
ncbi:methionine/alanine import family NSS transporter small subunit [Lederbergia citrea]|uniref:Methionine/alanine import family NSS transporter small subunit n=1 Tax=Lederbergia citrea TaxID=2833581 RepID=A0A942UP20_9BACI|nr:methionine/alanine import family NSS transporter small subunit [Lederbergia citrea]MBS4178549.1 methionine/alanine import family NSS transporter small subunit [Lederbergia citrea]MBS4205237.1 methionine/alanine import family NSS transporter small subunit [Lederbergia citrea]MBS4222902.1 methionine/alanine import family NSS transporter small subunit [Lederbergia citrea]